CPSATSRPRASSRRHRPRRPPSPARLPRPNRPPVKSRPPRVKPTPRLRRRGTSQPPRTRPRSPPRRSGGTARLRPIHPRRAGQPDLLESTMSETLVPIRRALLSVSDKGGLVELARALAQAGVELLASGGTRTALAAAGLDVIEVADYTGQPEVLGGRVKTLHPKIHAGILARREVPDDLATLEAQGFPLI